MELSKFFAEYSSSLTYYQDYQEGCQLTFIPLTVPSMILLR
jgi:hypothetical protein